MLFIDFNMKNFLIKCRAHMEPTYQSVNETAEKIMDVAEELIKSSGYHGFAFREIAKVVGIKSASVHYHFPTKDDLTHGIMQRYLSRFRDGLSAADEFDTTEKKINHFISMYKNEIGKEKNVPLCMVLSANLHSLPDGVRKYLKEYTELNLKWLAEALAIKFKKQSSSNLKGEAALILATLNGGLISSQNLGNKEHFNTICKMIINKIKQVT